MDERLRFVARLLEGDKMAVLCREFGISRKTGYKLYRRYRDIGLEGLTDRSRRPYRQANKLPFQVESRILQLRKEHPTWGAPKIREKLRRLELGVQTPAISTVHAVLDRHGLVTRRRRRRYKAEGTPLSWPRQPNELWCADFKGEFMLADHRYCYPLTIGLDPLLWTRDRLKTRCPRWPKHNAYTRRSSGGRWSSCTAPGAALTSLPRSSAARHGRSGSGSSRPIATSDGAMAG